MPIPEHPHWAVFLSRSWNDAPANAHSAVAWHFLWCWAFLRVSTVILQCHKERHRTHGGSGILWVKDSQHPAAIPSLPQVCSWRQNWCNHCLTRFCFMKAEWEDLRGAPQAQLLPKLACPGSLLCSSTLRSLCWTGLADAVLQPRLRCSALCMDVSEICISSLWISRIPLNTLFSELLIASYLCLHLFIAACKVCSEFGLWFCVCSS